MPHLCSKNGHRWGTKMVRRRTGRFYRSRSHQNNQENEKENRDKAIDREKASSMPVLRREGSGQILQNHEEHLQGMPEGK
jgi:hypothetical protein